jgi:hypothetical protein
MWLKEDAWVRDLCVSSLTCLVLETLGMNEMTDGENPELRRERASGKAWSFNTQ